MTECWTSLGPEDSFVLDLAETPWGVFAATRGEGVQRLRPDGSWEFVGLDHKAVWRLALVPGDAPRLLAGMGPGGTVPESMPSAAIYATEDGGLTWEPSDGGVFANDPYNQFVRGLVVDANVPGRMWWSQELPVVLRSDDRGHTWTFTSGEPDPFGGRLVALLSSPRGRVRAGDDDAFFGSALIWADDGGETWRGEGAITGGFETVI